MAAKKKLPPFMQAAIDKKKGKAGAKDAKKAPPKKKK